MRSKLIAHGNEKRRWVESATVLTKQNIMSRACTGITPIIGFLADPVIRDSFVRWAEKQPDTLSLPEAIRRLVELGLKAKRKT
jgi:hypothetical protein